MADPLDVVVLSRTGLQEVVDEAVERGRITRRDAAELVEDLLARARAQAEDLVTAGPPGAGAHDPALPVIGYDDLTAAEVVRELDGMDDGALRRVGEYERANANRKSVLGAVERKRA